MIEIQGLHKRYGRTWVLRDINVEISAGEFCCLFGPNGAGKSTLLRILCTLTPPHGGRVTIGGFDLPRDAHDVRRLIGYVAHQPMLYLDLSASENLEFYARLYGLKAPRARIDMLLVQVGLERRRQDRVRTFSRGMVQRLAIARALLADPAILLLDEPDDGLDPQAADELPAFLGHDRTVVMVSHNLMRGLALARRVLVLAKGRIALDAAARDLTLAELEQHYRRLTSPDAAGTQYRLAA